MTAKKARADTARAELREIIRQREAALKKATAARGAEQRLSPITTASNEM